MPSVFTLPYPVKKQLFCTFRTMHFPHSGPTEFTVQLPLSARSGPLYTAGIGTGDGININQTWSVHERDQNIKNMNKLSTDRLSPAQISSINKVAKDMLIRLGYSVLPSD